MVNVELTELKMSEQKVEVTGYSIDDECISIEMKLPKSQFRIIDEFYEKRGYKETWRLLEKALGQPFKETIEKLAEVEEKIEFETVQVRIPKRIMDMLRKYKDDIDGYLTYSIVSFIKADLETGVFADFEDIIKEFNLQPIFKAILDC
ncbi:hypothetical protein DRO19_02990 [Candidatus Bathyarchaeota archaeon]|nr:MAG: hypothetical protein DRO19_02990 [Candidatus Bathyarchaeota archaeon]